MLLLLNTFVKTFSNVAAFSYACFNHLYLPALIERSFHVFIKLYQISKYFGTNTGIVTQICDNAMANNIISTSQLQFLN